MRGFYVLKVLPLLLFLEMDHWYDDHIQIQLQLPICIHSLKPLQQSNVTWRLMPAEDHEKVDREVFRMFLNDHDEPIHMPWKNVRDCLIGRRISFIGDSLTRYQYLNLVHFITHGLWYSSSPIFEHEPLWVSWLAFYQGTTARLTTKNGQTREKCDCYRNPQDTLSRENRYYENLELNLSISYIQYSWGISKRGMHSYSLNLTNCRDGLGCVQSGCSPGACSETHWAAQDHNVLLEHIAATFHPDTLIFNSGIWHRLNNPHDKGFTSAERINDLLDLSRTLPQYGIRNLIWKTTTATNQEGFQLGASELESIIPALESDDSPVRWKILDAYSLTSSVSEIGRSLNIPVYFDAYHFIPEIYRGLNEVLFNLIASD